MNDDRLNAKVRSLASAGSRRDMVAAGLLGLMSLGRPTDATEKHEMPGRCARMRCAECSRCKRGRCRTSRDGISCSEGGECRDGHCQH